MATAKTSTAKTSTTTRRTPAKAATASGNPARRAAARAPQDRKPKATPAAPPASVLGEDGTFTVTLDGLTFTVDATPAANLRLMRKIKRNDLEAVMDFVEAAFGDDLDAIEEHFDLTDAQEYVELFRRACEAAKEAGEEDAPNS